MRFPKVKDSLFMIGLATAACAHTARDSNSSSNLGALQQSGSTNEMILGKNPSELPFSMLGVSQGEVVEEIRRLIHVLGGFNVLGFQSDGSVVECEVAPKGNNDMAMGMAIANTRQTLNVSSVATTSKSNKSSRYPDMVLMGMTSGELKSGEIVTCTQSKHNTGKKSTK